ncbi:MAG: autotransporter-associated beta strand repeat-containing protein, partial [Verrucomicrobiota bacterium]
VSGCNNNFVSLGGGTGVSLWDLGNHPLALGNTLGGIAAGTNNFMTLFSGGVLTNVAAVILSGSGSLLKFNGGTLAAGASGYLISNAPGAVSYTNYVQAGGAVINDCGYWVTNPLPMLQDPNSTGGGLTKLGSGTLALFGGTTFTGPMTISAGALVIGGTGLLGNGNYSSALVNNGVFTYASTAAQTMGGVISGPGQLSINSGALLLTGINTYTGPTVISAGTLVVGGMGLLGSGNYSSALINNGVFTYASTASQILSGVISGTGSTIINSGTLLLNGDASAATNLLTVNGGFFGGTGTNGGNVVMNAGSGLVPGGTGGVGTLTLTNNLTLNGNNLCFDLVTNAPTTNDLVVVGNTLYLTNANSVTLTVANGIPAGNYTLMTFANGYVGTGTFALAGFTNKATLALNANSLVLQVGADGIYPDTWKGYVNGTWDISVSNWINNGTATHFNAGDNVLFDDTLVKSSTISNASPGAVVSPNSVLFNNNLTNYTIKANIAGTGGLTLSGSA